MYKQLSLRRTVALAWSAVAVCFLLPLWLVTPMEPTAEAEPEAKLPIDRPIQTGAARDKGRAVRLLMPDGRVEQTNMADYLWRVVGAEMPASFEPEALKAQACAARTYTVRLQNTGGKHENADICTDSKCCQAWLPPERSAEKWGAEEEFYIQKLKQAVSETDGLGALYEGQPIQALFFSSAPGKTTDAVAVWGNSVDYLKSVDSPEGEEVPNYRSSLTLSPAEVKEKIAAAYPGADLGGSPAG